MSDALRHAALPIHSCICDLALSGSGWLCLKHPGWPTMATSPPANGFKPLARARARAEAAKHALWRFGASCVAPMCRNTGTWEDPCDCPALRAASPLLDFCRC